MADSKYARFAQKMNDQIADYTAGGRRKASDFIVDPGKFGRLASSAPDAAKYAVCHALNALLQKQARLSEVDVKAASTQRGSSKGSKPATRP